MKEHLILKMRERHPDDDRIPDWVGFIEDKSAAKASINSGIDRLLGRSGLEFWITNEFKPAGIDWDEDENRQGLDRTYRIILQKDYTLPAALIDALKRDPSVEDARRLHVGVSEIPGARAPAAADPALSTAASLERGFASELIHLGYAHALTKGNPEIKIAVLDTGVNLGHPELKGKFRKGMDFVDLNGLDTTGFIGDFIGYDEVPEDEVGHGTHVSGILSARGLEMDEGVAPGCTIIPVRVLAAMKSGPRVVGAGIIDNINVGIKWAVDNGADVINMSLGIRHQGGGLPHEDVIRYALSKNVTVVAASGNDGTSERYYPGALPGVIAVGAVDASGDVTPFTSYGANIHVVAPGLNIYSASLDKGYAIASGTSQASPFVCGTVGLFKSFAAERGRTLANRDIAYILKATSDKVDSRLRNEHAGYGLINLADAFKLLSNMLN